MPLGGHQYLRLWYAGDDQQTGGIADFIGLLVGNDLDRLVRFLSPGFSAFAHNPEPGLSLDIPAFRRLSGNSHHQRAIFFSGKLERSVATYRSLTVARIEDCFVAASAVIVLWPDQLGVEGRAHWISIVVPSQG